MAGPSPDLARAKLSDEHEQGSCSLENFKSSSQKYRRTCRSISSSCWWTFVGKLVRWFVLKWTVRCRGQNGNEPMNYCLIRHFLAKNGLFWPFFGHFLAQTVQMWACSWVCCSAKMLFDHKFVAMNRCWIFSSSVRDAMNVRCFWVHLVQTRSSDSLVKHQHKLWWWQAGSSWCCTSLRQLCA